MEKINSKIDIFILKARRKLWSKVVAYATPTRFYCLLYRSYWHYIFHISRKDINSNKIYFSARPNPGAGIGHQMANWIAGYWFAKKFELKFANIAFSDQAWEDFLGFGQDEITVDALIRNGYKKRRLPLFGENKTEEVERTKKIIASYAGQKVVFICEQDQSYSDQFGVMDDIQRKFFKSHARKKDQLIYSPDHFNIAIHVRRGDILSDPHNPNLQMRFISNDYFLNTLNNAIKQVHTTKPVHMYFFSQGKPEDYPEFDSFKNLHWCMDMGAKESFLHMVFADLLITSKSSFSYKPALLNQGIKVCPKEFWHGYPDTKDWILADNEGNLIVK
ncbi:hypothetical protein [Maribellus sediminis]|uniref:hypothetical protein n=1 Tax=Maribellus sediminis TaxID=2696285 RepID=UPI001430EF3F|nr:hypothetical protein [Maribellus sediminis]